MDLKLELLYSIVNLRKDTKKMLSKIRPEAGKILISEPFMMDPHFRRSVVLVVEHSMQGTVGFVLNQETEVTVPDIIPGFPMFDARIRMGGPVQTDTLHFIHRIPHLIEGGLEIEKGLFWGGDFDLLRVKINLGLVNINDVMFFLGYSGWEHGQLEEEIDQNSWIVASTQCDQIFNEDHDDFWKDAVKSLGQKYAHIANFPENPQWN